MSVKNWKRKARDVSATPQSPVSLHSIPGKRQYDGGATHDFGASKKGRTTELGNNPNLSNEVEVGV